MHSSSDIFCFKEPKIGESDGSQIYAVDGSCFSSCFSKIQRRHHPSSEVFQFEYAKTNQGAPKRKISGEEEEDLDELCELARIETQQPTMSGSALKRSLITGVGLEEERVSQKRHFKAAYNEHSNGLFNLDRYVTDEANIENGDDTVDADCNGLEEDEKFKQKIHFADTENGDLVEIPELDEPETKDPEEPPVSGPTRRTFPGDGLEVEAADDEDSDKMSDIEEPKMAKASDGFIASPSSVKRNFLTGTGLEDAKVSQRKHCPQKADKWLW